MSSAMLRKKANDAYNERSRLSAQALAARIEGERALASRLGQEAKEMFDMAENYNRTAAQLLFQENNAKRAPGDISLLGLYVKEALFYAEQTINDAKERGAEKVKLIVGKGDKVRPAVLNWCQGAGLDSRIDPKNPGALVVVLAKKAVAIDNNYHYDEAVDIFGENNKDLDPGWIDLHGLYVKEALLILKARIHDGVEDGEDELKVIVGKGNHSVDGVSKLKPAVEELLEENYLDYHVDPKNSGVLVINLSGETVPANWQNAGYGPSDETQSERYTSSDADSDEESEMEPEPEEEADPSPPVPPTNGDEPRSLSPQVKPQPHTNPSSEPNLHTRPKTFLQPDVSSSRFETSFQPQTAPQTQPAYSHGPAKKEAEAQTMRGVQAPAEALRPSPIPQLRLTSPKEQVALSQPVGQPQNGVSSSAPPPPPLASQSNQESSSSSARPRSEVKAESKPTQPLLEDSNPQQQPTHNNYQATSATSWSQHRRHDDRHHPNNNPSSGVVEALAVIVLVGIFIYTTTK